MARALGAEAKLQIAVADYCMWRSIPMLHIANERKCSIGYGMQLKRMGVRAGVSDCFFLRPTHYPCAWLELKIGNNKPTALQMEFIQEMRSYGHFADWVNSFDKAVAIIDNLHVGASFTPIV